MESLTNAISRFLWSHFKSPIYWRVLNKNCQLVLSFLTFSLALIDHNKRLLHVEYKKICSQNVGWNWHFGNGHEGCE
jgi:hypothetical protein